MDNDTVRKPSAPFLMKDLYKKTAKRFPCRQNSPLEKQALGLHLLTGMQEEPTEKFCLVKLKAKRAKHTIGSIMQHRNDFKQSLAVYKETEDDDSKQAVLKANRDPNATNKDENPNFSPPFVVDLLTQENGCDQESVQSPLCSTATFLGGWELGGWANTPTNWVHVFPASSMEGGTDFFVNRHALGEAASSLFRDLTIEGILSRKKLQLRISNYFPCWCISIGFNWV
jgi:hypothetical protein